MCGEQKLLKNRVITQINTVFKNSFHHNNMKLVVKYTVENNKLQHI